MGYISEIAGGGAVQTDDAVRSTVACQQLAGGSFLPFSGLELDKLASAIMTARRDRGDLFGRHLFADPAWDILLVLTIAECRQRRMTISQLCDRVDVPPTTALRWIVNLTDEGLLVRRDDMTDKRRKFIGLSPETRVKIAQHFLTAAESRSLAV